MAIYTSLSLLAIAVQYYAQLASAQVGGQACTGTKDIQITNVFGKDGGNGTVCNVDPSQENYDLAIGFVGNFCPQSNNVRNVVAKYHARYHGHDGRLTRLTASPTTLSTVSEGTFFAEWTGVPYSVVAASGVRYDVTLTAAHTRVQAIYATYQQIFSQTLFLTDTTTTTTQTVPSTKTTTSTITNHAVSEAPTSTTTITETSGEATKVAPAKTTTVSKTITRFQRTKTLIRVNYSTVTSSCVAASSAAKARLARRSAAALEARQDNFPPQFLLPECGTLSSTTKTTSTSLVIATKTAGVTTDTEYDSTTVTSTFTPTAYFYETDPIDTKTTTPTLTATTTIYTRSKTPQSTVTSTSVKTVTVTKYPKGATQCPTPSQNVKIEGGIPLTTSAA